MEQKKEDKAKETQPMYKGNRQISEATQRNYNYWLSKILESL